MRINIKEIITKNLTFIKYILVAGLSFLIDIILFSIFNNLLNSIILGTILARCISSLINYLLNKNKVFNTEEKSRDTLLKYYSLVIIQMLVSATLVDKLYQVIVVNPLLIKIPVELCIFMTNYFIQKLYIFKTVPIPKLIDNFGKYIVLALLTSFSLKSYIYMYLNGPITYILHLVLIILLMLFYFTLYHDIKTTKTYQIFTLVVSGILVLGYSYEVQSTGYLFWGSLYNFMISLIKVVGFYYFFKTLIFYLNNFLKQPKKVPTSKILTWYSKHPFLYSFIFLFLCYSVYLIAYYPGIINYDNANQIKEVLGLHTRYLDALILVSDSTLTNFNPIVHTLLLGLPIKFSLNVWHNFNFGLFIYTFSQMLICILIYSYALSYSIKRGASPLYPFVILLFMGIYPLFGFYSITAVKDTLYTAFLVLFSLKIYDFLSKKTLTFWDYFILFMESILVILFRNNGIYLVLIVILFLINKKNIKQIMMLFLVIFALYIGFNNYLLPFMGVSGTSIRETLSIPFQQTARLKVYHEEAFTEEDVQIISKILDYDNLEKDYDEDLSDPVKNKFNPYYQNEDLINYFKVWSKGLVQYPLIYIDSTINNISAYFNPFENSWKIYYKLNPDLGKKGFDYHYNKLDTLRDYLHTYEIISECVPTGYILNIGIVTWLSILLFINLCYKKKDYVILLPSIISILFCILSPRNAYYRYIYPSLILMLLLFPLIKKIMERKD